MAKGFKIGTSDFDDLFEAPYGSFGTVTFANLSPTCQYIQRYVGGNPNLVWYNGSSLYDAAPKGFIASNTNLVTVTTRGSWIAISSVNGGVSVNGTTYYNSSRGSYPIKRVGLLLCGGGGGGGGTLRSRTGSTANRVFYGYGGGGGGGAGVALCTLWLDRYTYYIYLGAGGGAGTGSGNGSSGGASYLRLTSSGGTTLVTCNGGGGGGGGEALVSYGAGGSGGSVSASYNGTYYNYNAGKTGGAGGRGGYFYTSPEDSYQEAGVNGSACSGSGYIGGISNTSASKSWSGSGGARQSSSADGGGGGASIGNGNGGYGSGGYAPSCTSGTSATYTGQAGTGGVAYIMY